MPGVIDDCHIGIADPVGEFAQGPAHFVHVEIALEINDVELRLSGLS
jgi:hypothetical protein